MAASMKLPENSVEKFSAELQTSISPGNGSVPTNNLVMKDYNLNIDKSLKKKLEAAKRPSVEYKYTGGGVTATLDATTFELFKTGLSKFYMSYPKSEGGAECKTETDKKGNVVQIMYRVSLYGEGLVGYTLNVYTTKSSLLVNGKSVEYFMDNDLSKIHKLISCVTHNGNPINIDAFNKILAAQLVALLNIRKKQRVNSSVVEKSNNVPLAALPSSDETERTPCYRCGRNVRTRAVFCTTGNHWIHYKCDRLSDEQIIYIESIEKTQPSDHKYTCTFHKSEDSEYKGTQTHDYVHINSQMTLPKLVHAHNDSSSCAEHILYDEIGEENELGCGICSLEVSDNDLVCENCNVMCHEQCSSQLSGIIYCNGCAATVNQIDEELNSKTVDELNNTHNSCLTESADQNNTKNFSCKNHGEVNMTIIVSDEERSVGTAIETDNSDNDKLAQVEPITGVGPGSAANSINDQSPDSVPSGKTLSNGGSQKEINRLKQSKKGVDEAEKLNNLASKQKDLRQLETKLKKKEDELKLKESKLWDSKNEKLRLEAYIQKIESRNDELEQTVRILRNKIKILEENANENPKMRVGTAEQKESFDTMYSKNTEQLVRGVHEKVTQFVMNRVDQQLSFLENSCGQIFPTQHSHMTYQQTNSSSYVPNNIFNPLYIQATNPNGVFVPINGFSEANRSSFNGVSSDNFNPVQTNSFMPNHNQGMGQNFTQTLSEGFNPHLKNNFNQTLNMNGGQSQHMDISQTRHVPTTNTQNSSNQPQQKSVVLTGVKTMPVTQTSGKKSDNNTVNKNGCKEVPDCFIVNTLESSRPVHLSSANESDTGTESYQLGRPLFEIRKELSSEPMDNGNKPFLCFRHPPKFRK